MLNPGKQKIKRLSWVQLFLVFLVAVIFLISQGVFAAYSAILGGLIAVLGSWILAKKLFAHAGASQARAIVANFYAGEALKIGLTVFLFGLVFYWGNAAAGPLFTGFIVAQFGIWFAPLVLK